MGGSLSSAWEGRRDAGKEGGGEMQRRGRKGKAKISNFFVYLLYISLASLLVNMFFLLRYR